MDEFIRRMALRLKLRKVGGSIVHHVALLKKALDNQGLKTRMIKGFCVIEDTKEACEHYWIRDETSGLDLDIAFQVACLRTPELMALRPVLLETLPPGLTRSDEAENMIREENNRLYDLYQEDSKAFWHEAPKDVVTFPLK
jgi:hypothetical protein